MIAMKATDKSPRASILQNSLVAILSVAYTTMSLAQPAAQSTQRLPDGAVAHHDLAYVANGHERQKLDLYLPKDGTNLRLIISIHGGAFRAGS